MPSGVVKLNNEAEETVVVPATPFKYGVNVLPLRTSTMCCHAFNVAVPINTALATFQVVPLELKKYCRFVPLVIMA